MRLGIGTVKGKWVNIHLLVSPEGPDHVAENLQSQRVLNRCNEETADLADISPLLNTTEFAANLALRKISKRTQFHPTPLAPSPPPPSAVDASAQIHQNHIGE